MIRTAKDDDSFKKGGTFLQGGMLTLPTTPWAGFLEMFDLRVVGGSASSFGITVQITAIGVNPVDATQTDYAFLLMASAAVTGAWNVNGPNDTMVLSGDMMLVDGAGQVVPSKRRFEIRVRA